MIPGGLIEKSCLFVPNEAISAIAPDGVAAYVNFLSDGEQPKEGGVDRLVDHCTEESGHGHGLACARGAARVALPAAVAKEDFGLGGELAEGRVVGLPLAAFIEPRQPSEARAEAADQGLKGGDALVFAVVLEPGGGEEVDAERVGGRRRRLF